MAEKSDMIRLYIGCGDNYQEGYVNIDPDNNCGKHKVDVVSPIEFVRYEVETVDEIRAEHVLEHFPRWMTELLLLEWHSWLKLGGLLRIVVPDFERTVLEILQANNEEDRCFKYRHIFGNHTSIFHPHMDGFSTGKLQWMLERHGYAVEKIIVHSLNDGGAYDRSDIECIASKDTAMPEPERRSAMIKALDHYGEMDYVMPMVDEYLQKIDGANTIPLNWWLKRYEMKGCYL